jgi:hypothetical protein
MTGRNDIRGEIRQFLTTRRAKITPAQAEPGSPSQQALDLLAIATPADQWHWRGAAPDHFMTHLSITEAVPGNERPEADWGEHVTDDEYHDR